MPRSALLVLRPVALGQPSWPARIVAARPQDAGWWDLLDQSGTVLHACDATRNAANDTCALILCGPRAVIDLIAAQASQSWTIAQFRADGGALATAIKSRWPVWLCNGVGFRFRFQPGALPALPYVSGSVTITSRDTPAWDRTMAGYADDLDLEATV